MPSKDPTGPADGEYKVIRGGSWGNLYPFFLRAANRYDVVRPGFRDGNVGFRCVAPPQDSK